MSKLYGVFLPHTWGMVSNKRRAIRCVKGQGIGEVRAMNYCPEVRVWDCTTFYYCSRRIFAMGKVEGYE